MGRKILFVTTDQQRYDTLGCNGGKIARTPVVDSLAASGYVYSRAVPQSVVCMPSRSTMLTGQHPTTHGVWMNGVPLPEDAPSVARVLQGVGYRTALIGKAHFEPYLDPFLRFYENALAPSTRVDSGVDHRGFDHLEFATHGAVGPLHYARWLSTNHPEALAGFYPVLDGDFQVNAQGGGDTGAPQVHVNPIPTEWYHTDWVASRTIAWLSALEADSDWFCWMSFPDPHHPWDPPKSELGRVSWKDVPLPEGYITSPEEREKVLVEKPRHWKMWYDGTLVTNYEAPAKWVPATLTEDQVREINALNAIECELIDEALGRVLGCIEDRGWSGEVDVIFTTDHGEFQGDYGLLFKGPYHVDSLMRLPLVWRPARDVEPSPSRIDLPVGLIDLAPTFCSIAGTQVPEWMDGKPLPVSNQDGLERGFSQVLTEWDSELFGESVYIRTITKDNWVLSSYLASTLYEGTEGEFYNLSDDPLQQRNLWSDPGYRSIRQDLADLLVASQPKAHPTRIPLQAPV